MRQRGWLVSAGVFVAVMFVGCGDDVVQPDEHTHVATYDSGEGGGDAGVVEDAAASVDSGSPMMLDASSCDDDGNECTYATVYNNQCIHVPYTWPRDCDFNGSAGACVGAVCSCNSDDDCVDDDASTTDQCIDASCVHLLPSP